MKKLMRKLKILVAVGALSVLVIVGTYYLVCRRGSESRCFGGRSVYSLSDDAESNSGLKS